MRHTASSQVSRAGMIKMETEVSFGHAQCLADLKQAIQNACDYTGLPHQVGSWHGGANSNYVKFFLKNNSTAKFFFKGISNRKFPRVEVRFRAKGPVVATIRHPQEAYRFINKYTK